MIRQTRRLSACTHGPHGSSQARTDGSGAGHRVVIVGGGFAGLAAARALRRAPVEVTVVDRTSAQAAPSRSSPARRWRPEPLSSGPRYPHKPASEHAVRGEAPGNQIEEFPNGRWRLSHRLAFNVRGLACRSEWKGDLHGGARVRRAVQ